MKNILIIILLMSIAMVGLIAIQIYWITFSVHLTENKLNQNIQNAIISISQRLERESRRIQSSQYTYNDSITYEISQSDFERDDVKKLLGINDVALLLDAADYSEIISKEFNKYNIHTPYSYIIYSYLKKQIVVKDGENIPIKKANLSIEYCDEATPIPPYDYKVDLFHTDYGFRGALYFYFDGISLRAWKDVWPILISSGVLLLGIIFAFVYTLISFIRQRRLTEMKNDFINNMTHEFKTPIATISLAADAVKSKNIIESPKKILRFMKIIKQENERMLGQVEKVLHAALLERGEYALNKEPVDMHDLIAIAVDNLSLKIEKHGGVIETHLEASNDIINVDKTHISNVVYNVLENADKYSPDKAHIIVSTYNSGSYFCLSIQDNGIGIEKEVQKMIFKKFYRVHTGNRHDVKGFGLGLAYVRAIMDAHKGKIDLKSEIGKGSTFTLMFNTNKY